MSNNKKVSGVWMDSQKAYVISTANETVVGNFEIISEIESDSHEDSDYKNDRAEQSRDNHDQKKYFKAIAAALNNDQEIFVFGPGKAQEQFKNFLEDYQNFNTKNITLGTSDKLSKNEMIAKVAAHFQD